LWSDVETIPENGTWFQLISNGTTAINTGPNGLQKLDQIIQHAEQLGLYVLLSLTNNWNPRPLLDNLTNSVNAVGRRDVTPGTNNSLPRNTLSNDYGKFKSCCHILMLICYLQEEWMFIYDKPAGIAPTTNFTLIPHLSMLSKIISPKSCHVMSTVLPYSAGVYFICFYIYLLSS
jgi:hypothetical protein